MHAARTFCQEVRVDALSRAIPHEDSARSLTAHAAQATRARQLTMPNVGWVVIAMHRSTPLSSVPVLRKVAQGRRVRWPAPA
jgi:hypothetical protein